MKTVIENATLVNEEQSFRGSLLIEDDRIAEIAPGREIHAEGAVTIDAEGMLLMPGVIDDHVHFREPGLTRKATMHTESMAAAAGGVTSVLDMPNVVPQTVTNELLQERQELGLREMHVNHAFFLGATNDNLEEVKRLDTERCPGVKLFMGSSTGNMLVDREETLRRLFGESPALIMAHCEDTSRINRRIEEYKARYGEDPDVRFHSEIRDEEACLESSRLAAALAREAGARLHIAHISTAEELALAAPEAGITLEACVPHLLYSTDDYALKGSLIKCNPAVKGPRHREALREALTSGAITTIGTDHAPHLLSEKAGGALKAVSGMPMVQFSLPSMLTLADEGVVTKERLVSLMCHNPARLFGIRERGFLRPGYKADLTLVKPEPRTIRREEVLSLCGWSPREGERVTWQVAATWVNGQKVWDGERVDTDVRGEALKFGAA
ncbi:MAG: dihydroorotase [Bacteroidaceae bacterium]|nr:dihydroorotase [Bacteroidaceae bacterium]